MFSLSPGIGYSLAAALVWGTYIFALKQYFEEYPGTVLTVGINAAALAWYLPLTVRRTDPATVPSLASFGLHEGAIVLGTILATAAAFLIFLRALEAGEVSYVAPISKIVPVFVLPIEVLFLQQRLTPLQVTGVVVATLAVYVANYRTGSLLDPVRKAASSRAAQFGLLSAACFALSDVGKRVALQELALPLELWVPTVLGGVLVAVLPLAVREWVPIRDALPKFLLAGGGVALGEHITSLALSTVPASIASPIINTQAVVAVLLGGVLLREDAFRTRLVAAALAVVGVGLIAA
ncbi:EamA family transporter [Halobellus sp. Atlit-38R]|uniref:DMT family transporter n=1 Tax=Halobellus sp. Atlit-38R TaxID=2282131 RepID=UPI000EF20899|nr:DMT family transporter [Halobellus sp. Atlit-38R]RLM90376.1 EamA family transporter [Halobellus sp. Atlit-38R]